MKKYASLHNHTEFSNVKLIDSINSVKGLIDYGYELGLKAIAITDHDCLGGHIEALKHFKKKYADKDYQLILGNEIYVTREGLCKETHEPGEKFFHCILLAKDTKGHEQLRQLSSRAWDRAYTMFILRTPTYLSDIEEIVSADPGHLICTTACLGSYTGVAFSNGQYERIEPYLEAMKNLFGDDFFIELQPSFSEDQIKYNTYMVDNFWGKYNFSVATDSHYLKKDERELHKAFLQAKEDGGNREVDEFYSAAYLMSAEEVESYLIGYISEDKIDTMFENTLKMASRCGEYDLFHEQIVPKIVYEWSEREEELHEQLKQEIISFGDKYPDVLRYFNDPEEEADDYLSYLIAEGYYSDKIADPCEEYIARLNEELYHIHKISIRLNQPLSDYFITMAKIIDIVWEGGDSLVGPGRGSGCGSLINYLVGITQLNPLRQELTMPFWRFMHESKAELPDIDFDTESMKRNKIFNAVSKYFNSIGSEVINVCTVGTYGTKSSIKTAGKGLDIEDTELNYIASLVPSERGKDLTLDQCRYGDDEHSKITAFDVAMNKYPQLWALSKRIEGLVTNLSVHASGVLILNGKITDHNSIMRTSKGVRVTAWDLHDSEECGALKYDFLTVQGIDKIRACMNLLLEDQRIEWQGSLKETYNKYLLPMNLDYDNPEMWKMVANGEILELFQFDTNQGSKAVKLIKPTGLKDLAAGNSVMRLMCEGEQPLDIFSRHKKDIQSWYKEMNDYGLSSDEQTLLKGYLDRVYGVAGSQELVMQLSMDPHISNFSVAEANKLRKGIAKKKADVIEEVRQLFFTKGKEAGTSDKMLSYIWEKQIGLSLGYSFSDLHTVAYSTIALQEMNLAYKYPLIYWNCACLSVNANAINDEDYEYLMEEGVLAESEEEDEKKSSKIDYAKIATAIGKFDSNAVVPPDINKAKMGFMPDIENNTIIFGLKGISAVGDDIVREIIARRPFSSVNDFVSRMRDGNKTLIAKNKVVNLIKAGCFDSVENKPRAEIMKNYIDSLVPYKSRMNLQNALGLARLGFFPPELKYEAGFYIMNSELKKSKDNGYIYLDSDRIHTVWFRKYIGEPKYINNRPCILESNWASEYEKVKNAVRPWIKAHESELIEKVHEVEWNAEWNKYCQGDILKWELDSLGFFRSGHPLQHTEVPYEVTDIADLKENDFDGVFNIKGQITPRYNLHTILGTVLVKDKKSGMVILSTPSGIIRVKLYKASFAKYDKVITDDAEEIIEDSFLDKGNHLLITGILRDDTFIPKVYKNTTIMPILKVNLNEDNSFSSVAVKS